jgi:hypothetical protein
MGGRVGGLVSVSGGENEQVSEYASEWVSAGVSMTVRA